MHKKTLMTHAKFAKDGKAFLQTEEKKGRPWRPLVQPNPQQNVPPLAAVAVNLNQIYVAPFAAVACILNQIYVAPLAAVA
jgi:hypothetical protein